MFQTTKSLFERFHPDLVSHLNTNSPFWNGVRDNTITDEEIERVIGSAKTPMAKLSADYEAAVAIKEARKFNNIAEP